jgi:site-specific DNA recombinase
MRGGEEKMENGKLRFAALIRVSSENQDRRGESLREQTTTIGQAVKALGGTVTKWYSGQEHATAEYEKAMVDQLLKDCAKNLFDAVIVEEPSRWSRDNAKSAEGVEILKSQNIRFFSGTIEHNLFDPTQQFLVEMGVVMNQYFARIQAYKSAVNRIHRLKRGIPCVGSLPWGRTYDRKAQKWGIDEDKKRKIEWAAQRYLAGESRDAIAPDIGVTTTDLWKTLTQRAGDKWEVNFSIPRFKIKETIPLTIPRLLDEKIIEAIKLRAAGNRTFFAGQLKNQYLLARVIFCDECGYAMFGMKNKGNRRRYRHGRDTDKGCKKDFSVRARDIEEAVLAHVFAMMGDEAGMEKAMLKALPDSTKAEKLRERKSYLESELGKVETSRNRIIRSIAEGTISDGEAEPIMIEIRKRDNSFKGELEKVTAELQSVPTIQQIKQKAALIRKQLQEYFDSPMHLARMTFEEKRKLISTFFAGRDLQGRRLGVYVRKTPDGIKYVIRGIFDRIMEGGLGGGGSSGGTPVGGGSIEHMEEISEASKVKLNKSVHGCPSHHRTDRAPLRVHPPGRHACLRPRCPYGHGPGCSNRSPEAQRPIPGKRQVYFPACGRRARWRQAHDRGRSHGKPEGGLCARLSPLA